MEWRHRILRMQNQSVMKPSVSAGYVELCKTKRPGNWAFVICGAEIVKSVLPS